MAPEIGALFNRHWCPEAVAPVSPAVSVAEAAGTTVVAVAEMLAVTADSEA